MALEIFWGDGQIPYRPPPLMKPEGASELTKLNREENLEISWFTPENTKCPEHFQVGNCE